MRRPVGQGRASPKVLREPGYANVPDDDPWGRGYVVSPNLTAGAVAKPTDGVYVYGKGPNGTGTYPRPYTASTGRGGSVGYSIEIRRERSEPQDQQRLPVHGRERTQHLADQYAGSDMRERIHGRLTGADGLTAARADTSSTLTRDPRVGRIRCESFQSSPDPRTQDFSLCRSDPLRVEAVAIME
jgi:hypothetical protein